MWKVVKGIRELNHTFPSAKDDGLGKTAWAAFLKTKEGRKRSQLVSQVRRVAMQLAADAKDETGQPKNPQSVNIETYDCDWGSGTIWNGPYKLASSSHRKPAGEYVTMPGGWVDIGAMCAITRTDGGAVRAALEREL